MTKVFEVRLELITQLATTGRFSIPQTVVDILGLDENTNILIETTSTKGINAKVTKIKSGNEIYGGMDTFFDPGDSITVKVTRIN